MYKLLLICCMVACVFAQDGRRRLPEKTPAPVTEPFLEVSSVKCDLAANNFCHTQEDPDSEHDKPLTTVNG
ncbi:unnamed protein product, partial [Brenthis ino]